MTAEEWLKENAQDTAPPPTDSDLAARSGPAPPGERDDGMVIGPPTPAGIGGRGPPGPPGGGGGSGNKYSAAHMRTSRYVPARRAARAGGARTPHPVRPSPLCHAAPRAPQLRRHPQPGRRNGRDAADGVGTRHVALCAHAGPRRRWRHAGPRGLAPAAPAAGSARVQNLHARESRGACAAARGPGRRRRSGRRRAAGRRSRVGAAVRAHLAAAAAPDVRRRGSRGRRAGGRWRRRRARRPGWSVRSGRPVRILWISARWRAPATLGHQQHAAVTMTTRRVVQYWLSPS